MTSDLLARIAELEALNKLLADRNELLDQRNKHLESKIQVLVEKLFGRRSEKANANQLGLFEELAAEAAAEIEASLSTQADESKTKRRSRRNGRKPIPRNVPRRRTVLDLPEEQKTCPHGHPLEVFGEDVTEEVEVIPAQIYVNEIVRPKHKVVGCTNPACGGVHMAPLPARPIEQGRAGPGLLAHIAVQKYCDHLPLYRQSQIFARSGIDIHRSTMTGWMLQVASLLSPVVDEIKRGLLSGDYLQADETTIRVQGIKKGKMHKGYLWAYGVPWKDVVYEFTMGRSGEHPAAFLEGFRGHLQIDRYDGYNAAIRRGKLTRGGCMAHVRRGFWDARKDDPKRASIVLAAFHVLYRLESEWKEKGLSPEERVRARRKHASPTLDDIRKLLEAYDGEVLPQSLMGSKAISYALNEWPHIICYVDIGASEIDNNAIEHTIRPIALGRKHFLFAGSPGRSCGGGPLLARYVSEEPRDQPVDLLA